METEKLNRSQILKELQTHKKYRSKTQKEISEKLGGIANLRTELTRLKNKPKNKPIENDNILVNDVLYQIFLYSKYLDIIEMCSVNKQYKKICDNDQLWNQLMNRDFPFLIKKLNCDIYQLKVYNTYKKIYELIHMIINNTYINILSVFEKKRKSRYPHSIQKDLYDMLLNFVKDFSDKIYTNNKYIIDEFLMILNVPKKKNGDYYVSDLNYINNNLIYLSNDLNTIECNNIDLVDLKKLR